MSFTYTQTGPSPLGTLNLNSAHLKLTYANKKLIFFNDVSLGGLGSNIVASNTVQAPGFQFENTASNGLIYASNGVFTASGSAFNISGNTLSVPDMFVSGNLSVMGTVTTINTQTLVITDPIVQIGANVMDSSNVGLILSGGPSYANVAFGFQPGENAVVLTGTSDSAYGITMTPTSNVDLKVYGNVYAAQFIGDGGLLSNISGSTSSNLQAVTDNGNVTTQFVTLGGLTTTDGAINNLPVKSVMNSVTIGPSAGITDQAGETVAIGYYAGEDHQLDFSVAIGAYAGQSAQDEESVAVGAYAGQYTQGSQSVSIGLYSGQSVQGSRAIAIGAYAGHADQGGRAMAIGRGAGETSQGYGAMAIGYNAADTNQSSYAMAIGFNAGVEYQGSYTLAAGYNAGYSYQGEYATAIGNNAGYSYQASQAVAIGNNTGYYSQGYNAVAVGNNAGNSNQGLTAVAIGDAAGYSNQGSRGVAIGRNAGYDSQEYAGVAVGNYAGYSSQGFEAVAVGDKAAPYSQNDRAVAVGHRAGYSNQGAAAVAIGAYAGQFDQAGNSIIINATNDTLNASDSGFYVKPVRYVAGGSSNVIGYNTSTGELFDTGASANPPESQTLQAVTELGASTNRTVTFSNALAMVIQGDVEMASNNLNVYSVSTYSIAADNVNVTEIRGTTAVFLANVAAHGNVNVDAGVYAQNIVATGNATASYFIGDGSLLTNVSTTSNLETVTLNGATTNQTVTFSNVTTGLIVNSNALILGNITANNFIGDGSLLTNVVITSNLESITLNGATTNQTVTFSNTSTGIIVESNATILGNLEMSTGNMNVYSVSTYSIAADNVNVTEVRATTVSVTGDITGYSNAIIENTFSNTVTSNTVISKNILTDNEVVTGDLTVDGITTVQILKFTPYSGIDPDTGNASVIATVSGHTVNVAAAGVTYGSNVINLSGYSSPITGFNLTCEDSCQLYLYATNVSVNTTSTATVKYTNPATITNSNVLFHITKIANAGFSVVNAIIV